MTDQRRAILFLIPSLRGGGAERVIVNLLRHLDRRKFRLTLAVVNLREAVYFEDVPVDVDVIDLGCARVRHALPKIVCLIRKRRPDVVFSTLGHLNLALAIVRPLLPNAIQYIARETSIVSATLQSYFLSRWWSLAYRKFYGRFDKVVCQSRYMRDDLVNNFDCPIEKTVAIPNPVDIDEARHLSSELVLTGMDRKVSDHGTQIIHLVAAGRMVAVKGFDLLIEALALCGDKRLRLTLLGEGPMRTELERMAVEKRVALQVRFVGFQKNPYPFFAQADAFVSSSLFEGFPNVVLEALACGTPVIATPSPGGIREILEGVDGCMLADSVTAEGLAAVLAKASLGRRVSEKAVEAYSVETITHLYEKELMPFAPQVPQS